MIKAEYDFTIRFHEFHNPLGLQCDKCKNGGLPACCDDVERRENCTHVRPFTCDTRYRFMLRPFGASLETAPNTGFPFYTTGNARDEIFNEGHHGFLGLPNPFTIVNKQPWLVSSLLLTKEYSRL